MKVRIIVVLALLSCYTVALAQEETTQAYKPSSTQFMIRGYAHAGFEYQAVDGDAQSTFLGSSFVPIFIFKPSDRLLFEAELGFFYNSRNEVEVSFEYADVSYIVNDYIILRMGKFMLPFGTFTERLHPAWINRLSNAPLGFGHGGIAPAAGTGVEVRGAIPVGSAKLLYYAYAVNGPRLNSGVDEPEEAGQLMFENLIDNNNNKAFGGRLGLLPFSNSSLELGASVYGGTVGDRNDSLYSNVGALLYAFDFSYVRQLSAVRGILDIKAQYNISNVDQATYFEEELDGSFTPYTFNNNSNASFAQLSYRPTMAGNDIVKNFELVGRYSNFQAPEGSEWEQQSTQWSFGINYWLSWRTVFKVNYQSTVQQGGHGVPAGETVTTNGLFVHWAMGF